MANTYLARGVAVTNATNKLFMTVYNGVGSGQIIRIYRIWMTPISTASVTGGIGTYVFDKFTGVPSSGDTVVAMKVDSLNPNLNSNITVKSGNTSITGSFTSLGELLRISKSNDEPAVTSQTIDEIPILFPLSLVADWGFGDSEVEPLVLRKGQGLRIYSLNAGTWGASTIDILIQFTVT